MKFCFRLSFSLALLLVISCGPRDKETYLQQFEDFVEKVSSESGDYGERDWQWADQKFERFSGEYYERFRDELSWKETAIVKKYEIHYHYHSSSTKAANLINGLFSDEGQAELKSRLEYYVEHEMEDEIRLLLLKAEVKSIEAKQKLMSLLRDLKYTIKED